MSGHRHPAVATVADEARPGAPRASGPPPSLPKTRVWGSEVLAWPRVELFDAFSPDRRWGFPLTYDEIASGSTEFISRDLAVMATRSPYGYVGGNPLTRSDPGGLGDEGDGLLSLFNPIFDVLQWAVQAREDDAALSALSYLYWRPYSGEESSHHISTLASRIAHGHAWSKHRSDFQVDCADQLATVVDWTIQHRDDTKLLSNGRIALWNDALGLVVFIDPGDTKDFGTTFKPSSGKRYFDGL